MRMTDFQVGWVVLGNDGRRVGTVKGVTPHYIVTARPGFATDLYVPASFIANVEHEAIHLNLTLSDSTLLGWYQPPGDVVAERVYDLPRHV